MSGFDFSSYFGWSGGLSSISKYKSSLGWSSSRLSDTVNDYLFESKRTSVSEIERLTKLVGKAYNITRDMIVILNFPFDIKIALTKTSIVDYKNENVRYLFIPTQIFNESSLVDTEKVNTFCGNGIHEAAHMRYTERKVLAEFEKLISHHELPEYSKVTDDNYSILNWICNIIEDERVENNLLAERPGFAEFIDKYKLYQYRKVTQGLRLNKFEATNFFKNLFRVIRYPQEFDDTVMSKYSELFQKIHGYLEKKSNKTKETCIIGLKIFNDIIDTFGNIKFVDESTAVGFDKVIVGRDNSADIWEINDSLIDSSVKNNNSLVERLVNGSAEFGTKSDVYFQKTKGDKDIYQRIKNKISRYIPSTKKVIKGKDKNYEFSIPGCRSGKLDENKLVEAVQGVPQVYIRKGKVETNKTTVCVLIDESSSMCGLRESVAREAAILLKESLSGVGVDLYIYGHTADITATGSTEINVYKEGNFYNPDYTLSDTKSRKENRDGVAIYEVAKRIRKFTNSRCIMFVLSDGAPSAHDYRGLAAITDTAKYVNKVENMNFDVIQVSIATVGCADRMFKNIINLSSNISEFPRKLAQTIKKCIAKNKKSEIKTV